MKQLFITKVLSLFIVSAFSQNGTNVGSYSSLENKRFNLSSYLWSHANYKNNITDKPALDFDAIDNWSHLSHYFSISYDGKYFAYTIDKGIDGYKKHDSMIIQSTINDWKQSFPGVNSGFFSSSGKEYIFKYNDDLCFLQLGKNELYTCEKEVISYKLPDNPRKEWLAYHTKSKHRIVLLNLVSGQKKLFDSVVDYNFDQSGKWLACLLGNNLHELVIYNLITGMERRFPFNSSYSFGINGNVILLKTVERVTAKVSTKLEYIDLNGGIRNVIWSTTDTSVSLKNYNLDSQGQQVVFVVGNALDDLRGNSIWYYKAGMSVAMQKVGNQKYEMNNLFIQDAVSFTDNNRYILFSLRFISDNMKSLSDVSLDVWSHTDRFVQSTQSRFLKAPRVYVSLFDIKLERIMRIENEFEKLKEINGNYAVVYKGELDDGDKYWEKEYNLDSCWLISLEDDSRKLLSISKRSSCQFSPTGNYLVYCDANKQCNYFCIDLKTGKLSKISIGIPAWKLGSKQYNQRGIGPPKGAVGIVGWIENDRKILVYDNYDIWQMDLTGKEKSLNLTNGFGEANGILISLMDNDRPGPNVCSIKNDTLILSAFNKRNKHSGFLKKILSQVGDPEVLFMGPYFFMELSGTSSIDIGMQPLKAYDTSVWVVKRQTFNEAPNYYLTSNFKTFKRLTNFQSHKRYNWLTAELKSFKQLDGTISHGILYKPENFDSSKKYPVIISFYSYLSDAAYQYPTPGYLDAPKLFANPSWMVSHGYLVFTPDIYFTNGQWGPSMLNAINGAAVYLNKLPFVDSKRIGACGHSNSGRFGYYLLTHSNLFAAMSIGSGTADMLSMSLSGSIEGMRWAERDSYGTGLGNLWQNKKKWLDHISVLHVDKVTNPVLLFHNKKDPVPFVQAMEMFVSLYRMQKKVWLLQYDNGDHTLSSIDDLRDFTIRFTQFFDHYLKGAPSPKWMTDGIPLQLKQVEMRYELNTLK